MLAFLLAIMSFIVQPNGGGSTPNLAAVLAVGADGGAVDQTNLGVLALSDGKTISINGHQVLAEPVTNLQAVQANPDGVGAGVDTVSAGALNGVLSDHAAAINAIIQVLKAQGISL